MMHESETFEWNDVAPQLLFPIDYTSKEIERKFARDSRGFRNHVLKNVLFKGNASYSLRGWALS